MSARHELHKPFESAGLAVILSEAQRSRRTSHYSPPDARDLGAGETTKISTPFFWRATPRSTNLKAAPTSPFASRAENALLMSDETSPRPAGTPDDGGHRRGGAGEQSPLQARAAFFKNWHWQSVADLNRRLCARGGASQGINSETGGACGEEWEVGRGGELTLGAALDALRGFHRKAPFLFFNGNTFAEIGRQIAFAIFRDLPSARLTEAASAVAHYIAGVLDREAMVAIVEELNRSAALAVGDRVKSMRGSLRGVITRVLDDGRVAVRPDGCALEFISLPESLLPDD